MIFFLISTIDFLVVAQKQIDRFWQEQFKTLRFGIINLLSTASMAVGTALSGVTFRALNFYGVYVTTVVLYALGLLYGWTFVKEVPANRPDAAEAATCKTLDDGGGEVYDGFFDARHVKEAFRVTFKEGPHNRKLRISMLMWIAFLIMGPVNGELTDRKHWRGRAKRGNKWPRLMAVFQ